MIQNPWRYFNPLLLTTDILRKGSDLWKPDIRVHGNGFIQVNAGTKDCGGPRLHIWPYPELRTQKVSSQIHDHTFGFQSMVLTGRLLNVVYDVTRDHNGDHNLYEARPTETADTMLMLTKADPHCFLRVRQAQFVQVGQIYQMEPLTFHESVPARQLTATMMYRTTSLFRPGDGKEAWLPHVICPVDQRPDNDFSRYGFNDDDLWEIVDETLKQIHHEFRHLRSPGVDRQLGGPEKGSDPLS